MAWRRSGVRVPDGPPENMTIHKPRELSSKIGLGLNTIKSLHWINDRLAFSTEKWGIIDKPWQQDNTIIARNGFIWKTRWEEGKSYLITKYFDEKNKLIGTYVDICRPVKTVKKSFKTTDLYLDVWQLSGHSPIILDEDELNESVKANYLNKREAEKAIKVAEMICVELSTKPDIFIF